MVFYLTKNAKQVVEEYETLITNPCFFFSTALYKLSD